jgi:transposase
VGIGLDEYTPDHSTISRTRRLIDLDTHREVFSWVLGVLTDRGFVQGQRIAIDATTLEANAAMRSIVRHDTGESYDEFLSGLAKASGIETPTREDLVRLDRKRKKRTSNKDWKSPADEDARVTKMKDGRTHLAHKAEHAVDLDTGAVVAVTLQAADEGDTTTLDETLCEAGMAVAELARREAELQPDDKPKINVDGIEELVADKGYHSGAVVQRMKSYWRPQLHSREAAEGAAQLAGQGRATTGGVSESAAGARQLRQELTQTARRIGRAQLCPPAACGAAICAENIQKRQLIHVGAFNLSLILRKLLGAGTPREMKNRAASLILRLLLRMACPFSPQTALEQGSFPTAAAPVANRTIKLHTQPCRSPAHCTTGC